MDRVNDTLLLSLKQEIKSLNDVVESITHLCGESNEISSWLFPTKSCDFVNNLIHGGFSDLRDFRSYLELIVDRLYVGIRLILNYIDSVIEQGSRENRLIRRPKQLTLGFTFQALWTAISVSLAENMNRSKNKETATDKEQNTGVYTVNKAIQTEIIALNKCDSCSASMLCMKNLLQSFDDEKDNQLKTKRQLLRPKIYDITQFGCMLQTTTTIENSLSTTFEKLYVKEQENELLQNENKKLKTRMANTFGKITLLEREVDVFKEKYEKGANIKSKYRDIKNYLGQGWLWNVKHTFKITLLSSQNEDLVQRKSTHELQINTLEEIIKNLNSSIKCYREKIQTMGQNNESINNALDKISEKQVNLVKLSTEVQEKCSTAENEQALIASGLKEAENIVDNINNKLNTFTKIHSAVKNKIVTIHNDIVENSSFIMSKSQDFLKCVKQHNINISIYQSRIPKENVPGFQIKGDPVEDLARQIEENKEKINQLQRENDKLENIITKFNRMKN